MTDMVEPVARAIYEGRNGKGCTVWAHLPKSYQEPYLKDAIAAIKAIREPTKIMIDAVREIGGPQAAAYAIAAWPTMIDAALGENK